MIHALFRRAKRGLPSLVRFLVAQFGLLLGSISLAAADAPGLPFDVPAGTADKALRVFSQQSGLEVVFSSRVAQDVMTQPVKGTMAPRTALDTMLKGTSLEIIEDPRTGAFSVRRNASGKNVQGPAANREAVTDGPSEKPIKLEAFEIMASKLINADLPRTRDDSQPYVVFGREQIQSSMAPNLDDFFKTRLPMNQVSLSAAQANSSLTTSNVNLRGLGSNQTLILVDGRRLPPRASAGGSATQADINGIPLSMIERIEILPSTASGIFGGGATGGVINIITRKDYAGVDLTATYSSPFDTDAGTRRLEINGSWALGGGRTQLTFSAGWSESNLLTYNDRTAIALGGRALQLVNNPAAFYTAATPPNGYLPNIRSQSGANLVLKFNNAPLNSPRTFVPAGYTGVASDNGVALVANAGNYDLGLGQTSLSGTANLLAVSVEKSASLGLRHSFTPNVEAYLDFSLLRNRGESDTSTVPTSTTLAVSAPNNPFTTPIVVSFPAIGPSLPSATRSHSMRAMAGVNVKLPREWVAGGDYVWSRSLSDGSYSTALLGDPDGTGPAPSITTALSSGALDVVRDLNRSRLDYTPYLMARPRGDSDPFELTSHNVTVRASGALARLPAGPVSTSLQAEWRRENVEGIVYETVNAAAPTSTFGWYPAVHGTTRSYNAQILIPVFSENNQLPFVRGLEVQTAARHDDYEALTRADVNPLTLASRSGPFPALEYITRKMQATKYTVGAKYSPNADLALRGSWGSGFLPPSLSQLGSSNTFTAAPQTLIDPKRGNISAATGPVEILQGGSPDLQPEESESVSAGVIVTPRFLPGFRLSADLTRIKKTNEIAGLTPQQQLNFEDVIPNRVRREPLTAADRALGYTGGAIIGFNNRSTNIAERRMTAYDFQADYTVRTTVAGNFMLYALATYQTELSSRTTPDAPLTKTAGYSGILKWRGNGGVDWTRGPWSLGWNAQYYHSYIGYGATSSATGIANYILNQGSARIPSQLYHDIVARYRFGPQSGRSRWRGWLNETTMTIGVQNVFDTLPPAVASTATLVTYSTYGDPRLRRYQMSIRKHF